MTLTRRAFAAGLAAALAACRTKSDRGPIARGAEWLASQQGEDGSWVSDVYGAFKDGFTLTPFATLALLESGTERDAARRGAAWLAAKTKEGRVVPGRIAPSYPAYTAALATRALSHADAGQSIAARDAWLAELRGRQLTEALGWSPSDPQFGGWGYSTAVPKKPPAGSMENDEAFLESNLSTTAFALDAFAAAGVPSSDACFADARRFVDQQQNFSAEAPGPDDDGGFFFIPEDEVRNKAGRTDTPGPHTRFHSYGTMTSDGLRSLLRCGSPAGSPRASAARRWLHEHFDAAHHPGTYRADREEVRDSAWFYWAASLSATASLDGDASWCAAPLRAELLRRQRPDGSWQNDLTAVREDDPLVATCFALLGLSALPTRV